MNQDAADVGIIAAMGFVIVMVVTMVVTFIIDLTTNGLDDEKCEGTTLVSEAGWSVPDAPECL